MKSQNNHTSSTPETNMEKELRKVHADLDSLPTTVKGSNSCTRTTPEINPETGLKKIYEINPETGLKKIHEINLETGVKKTFIDPDSIDLELLGLYTFINPKTGVRKIYTNLYPLDFGLPGCVFDPDVLYSALFIILLKTCLFLEEFFTISSYDVSIVWNQNSTSMALRLYLTWCHNRLGYPLDPYHCLHVHLYISPDERTSILARCWIGHHPELARSIEQFLDSFITTAWKLAAVFDVRPNPTGSSDSKLLEYFECFAILGLYPLAILLAMLNSSRDTPIETFVTRIKLYLNSMTAGTQLELQKIWDTVSFLFTYTIVMLLILGDVQEEPLSFFNTMCWHLFLFTLAYLLCNYFKHHLFFREAAKNTSKTISPASHAFRDSLKIVRFAVQFTVLIIWVYIHDRIDDTFDSYDILLVEFEEDRYLSEPVSFENQFTWDEVTLNLSTNPFNVCYFIWGEFAYRPLFLLEEIYRLIPALYVIHLLVFEINVLNQLYSEVSDLTPKRATSDQPSRSNHNEF